MDSIVDIFSRSLVEGPGTDWDWDWQLVGGERLVEGVGVVVECGDLVVRVEGLNAFEGRGGVDSGRGLEMWWVTRDDAEGNSTSLPSFRDWINR
jgi:hypothetical protein